MTRCRRLANPAVDPEVIERKHSDYNEENSMLRRPFTSPGYHTTIKEAEYVHPIIAALDYALAILDSGDELHRERAFNTLRTVLRTPLCEGARLHLPLLLVQTLRCLSFAAPQLIPAGNLFLIFGNKLPVPVVSLRRLFHTVFIFLVPFLR
ncbi:hypothetical protein [Paenibacillus sp. N3.4]|uniref:hypothetical protein n=1 Tax=Paenibacillus sp. N3.4 TaxID=2603222 RepID=UPI0011CB1720|nr:hypothetical protein [Paenibacillus sp. N3.4]TXK70059.1 hypothetical protein FU659_33975 [Paenibacillus sp. N3.4]